MRGLWTGVVTWSEFVFSVSNAIENHFVLAWREGARQAGLTPDELTQRELDHLRRIIFQEQLHVSGLADWVERNSKANGGKLGKALSRLGLWLNRYDQVVNLAKVSAATDKKFIWIRHAEDSCKSCLALEGKVKRLSFWSAADVRPQHPTKLECMRSANGVVVCKCELNETTQPVSPGPLPALS